MNALDFIRPTPRRFADDLAYSLKFSEEVFWQAVYRRAFPNLIHTELCGELDKQKQGVDRVLYLSNGNVLYVDEKKREKDYGDILLIFSRGPCCVRLGHRTKASG